jgi:hypothetical protein
MQDHGMIAFAAQLINRSISSIASYPDATPRALHRTRAPISA